MSTTSTTPPAARGRTGVLRLGTRRSALARTQSGTVADALRSLTGADVELVDVVTEGDVSRASLSTIGGTGVFASALREAVLAGEVDLAVHSLKDLPTAAVPGLVLAAVPARQDPRDVLVAAGGARLADLPAGARVGTGSPRRAAQLRSVRPDLRVQDVRGNIDTRLALVADGQLDAVVLARSGLLRIGRADEVSEVLDVSVVLPAPGQGALAVECRADDAATLAACARLDDAASRLAVTAERALLAALEAGCTAPIGALATALDDERAAGPGRLRLRALVAAPDGSRLLAREAVAVVAGGDDARELGRSLAAQLLDDGAPDLVQGLAARAVAPANDAVAGAAPAASPPPTTGPITGRTTPASTPPPDPTAPPDPSARTAPPDRPTQSPLHDPHETAATAPPERAHP